MKNSRFLWQLLCSILVFALAVTPVYATNTETDFSVQEGCRTIDAQVPMQNEVEKLEKTYSALLFDTTNDVLLYAKNPDQQYYPAGLVKIMTALMIAERANLSDLVTVEQEVLDTIHYASSGLNFKAGEVISMQELLYCILVQGANEAAVIAADHISGSQETFVQEMNTYAAELGCTGTTFVNVHGLHDALQVTTARDIAKIICAGMKNDIFTEAFATYAHKIPATNKSDERRLSSDNFLLNRNLGSNHFENRATGSRMGITADGEINLAVVAESNDIQLISIVLGSTSEINPNGEEGCYKEARILLDKGFNEHKPVHVLHENQVLEQFKVENGENYVSAFVKVSAKTSLPLGVTDADLSYRYIQDSTTIQAPVKAGDHLSKVQIWYLNVCLAQADLYALHDVSIQEATSIDEITEEPETSAFTVLIIVAVIIGLLVILLFGRRVIFRMIRKHQVRRQRRNRRRSR